MGSAVAQPLGAALSLIFFDCQPLYFYFRGPCPCPCPLGPCRLTRAGKNFVWASYRAGYKQYGRKSLAIGTASKQQRAIYFLRYLYFCFANKPEALFFFICRDSAALLAYRNARQRKNQSASAKKKNRRPSVLAFGLLLHYTGFLAETIASSSTPTPAPHFTTGDNIHTELNPCRCVSL